MYSVSDRHDDDRQRNALDVFLKASTVPSFPIFADLYRLITEFAEVHDSINMRKLSPVSCLKNHKSAGLNVDSVKQIRSG